MRLPVSLILVASAMVACNNKSKGADPVVAAPTQAGAASPAPAAGGSLVGTVLERIDASPYCYLRLKTTKGEVWAAVPEGKIEKGAEVNVANPMLMTNFESKTLKRTFAEIYFGSLAPAGTPAAVATPSSTDMPHQAPAATPVKVGKVEKATGPDARNVGEVWSQKDGMKDKSVTVRGVVVKYNPGVMGKNWIHLQDGSGDEKAGTHDLTFTSQDAVAKGDTVTIKGVLRLNKDFGSGYKYPVIVEDSKVVKK